jgi:hypothetical protein
VGGRDGSRDQQATSTGRALGLAGLHLISRGEPA